MIKKVASAAYNTPSQITNEPPRLILKFCTSLGLVPRSNGIRIEQSESSLTAVVVSGGLKTSKFTCQYVLALQGLQRPLLQLWYVGFRAVSFSTRSRQPILMAAGEVAPVKVIVTFISSAYKRRRFVTPASPSAANA